MKKISLCAIFLSLTFAARLRGVGMIDVTPTANPVTVPAGASYAGKVMVRNVSQEAVGVSSTLMDWVYEAPTGAKKYFPKGKGKFSCAKWFSYSPAQFKLAPGQTQIVQYTVNPPADASGGYYPLILFSQDNPEKVKADNNQGVTINLVVQIACVFMVDIDKTQIVKGAVRDLKIVSAKAGQNLEVEAAFKNEGNVRINAEGKLSILDATGNAVGWTKFPPIKTLPGDEWAVKASWAGLEAGKYHLVATFELAPGKIIVKETDVTVQ